MRRPASLLSLVAAAFLAVSSIAGATPLGLLAPARSGERASAALAKDEPERYEVLRVVDGDTIHIRRDGQYEKLRLLSVDTEERMGTGGFQGTETKPQTVFGEECAKWAIRFFKDLADEDSKTYVSLRFPDGEEERDVYGRLLCHVVLPDGRDFNVLLVELGKSPYFNKYGNSRIAHEDFVAAQAEARAAGLGIWNPAVNQPTTPGAPAARRPYDRLLPWWDARAEAIDGFRARSAEEPEKVISSEDADAVEAALKAGREVEVFGSVDRTFEESNGDLTVLLRATDKSRAVRAVVPRRLRKELAQVLDLEATQKLFRQNYLYVRGVLQKGSRGPELRTASVDVWRLAGPEPAVPAPAASVGRGEADEAGAPR